MSTETYAQTVTRMARHIREELHTTGDTLETMDRRMVGAVHLAQDHCREAAENVGLPGIVGIDDLLDEIMAEPVPDEFLEKLAKIKWDAFQPEADTIDWFDKWFANTTVDLGPRSSEYRARWSYVKEWRAERAEFEGGDEAWLSILREQYEECLADNARWEAEAAANEGGVDVRDTGHVIGTGFSGIGHDNVVLYSFC